MMDKQSGIQRPIARAFGRLLKAWREERGLSQERLAELSGCDRSFLSRLERGINAPTLTVAAEIGLALGLSPSAVFSEVGAEVERELAAEPAER